MRLIDLRCPNCGAVLRMDMDNMAAYCTYCGSRLFIETNDFGRVVAEKEQTKRTQYVQQGMSNRFNYQQYQITERQKFEKEMQLKEKREENRNSLIKIVVILGAFLLMYILIMIGLSLT